MDQEKKKAFVEKLKRDREEAFLRNEEKKNKKKEKAKMRCKILKEFKKPKENPEGPTKSNTINISTTENSCSSSNSDNSKFKFKIAGLTKSVSSDNQKQLKKTSQDQNQEKIICNINTSTLSDPSKEQKKPKRSKPKQQKSSSKERMQKLRCNLSEEKKALIREKDRERKKKARAEGKVLKISEMTKKQQSQERKKWKERQRKSRLNKKILRQVVENTPPSSDIENEFEERIPINESKAAIPRSANKVELTVTNSSPLINISNCQQSNTSNFQSLSNNPSCRSVISPNLQQVLTSKHDNILHLPSTPQQTHLKKQGQKRSKKTIKFLHKKIREMEQKMAKQQNEIKKIRKEKEKYKKRWQRRSELTTKKTQEHLNKTPPQPEILDIDQNISPATKVENMLQGRVIPEDVKKELVFASALTKQIETNLSQNNSTQSRTIKTATQRILSGNILKKYKLHKKIKHFVSYKNNKKLTNNDFIAKKKTPYKITKSDKDKIKDFFHLDNISRQCPGKRDVITRRKVKKQKRLLLHNLKTCYTLFRKMHPTLVISFSSFYKFKPFWIVEPKLRDRETCACVKHENFNFIMQKCFLEKIIDTKDINKIINGNFGVILDHERENDSCKVNQWKTKTEERKIKDETKKIRVTAKTAEHMNKSELLELFRRELPTFRDHVSLVKHQINYLNSIKEKLESTQLFLQIDFSENYVAKLNTEIQSMHFGANKKQISIHTGVAYYNQNMENKKEWSFATISDNLDHQAHAVWSHMKPVINFLIKQFNPNIIEHIFIFSDGPTSQYRNRYNLYLAAQHLSRLFPNAKVCWNFSAPGHGKGPMDGIGGTVKRLADRKVLQGSDITCAKNFVDVVEKFTRIKLFYIDSEDIQLSKLAIPPNLPKIKKIGATYQLTWSIQNGQITINMRSRSCDVCLFEKECVHFSQMERLKLILVVLKLLNFFLTPGKTEIAENAKQDYETPCDIDIPAIGSWVATIFDEHWYPGMVISVDDIYITVKFPTRKGKNYIWSTKEDVQRIKFQEILCILPNPPTGVSKSRPDLLYIPDEDYVNSLYEQIL